MSNADERHSTVGARTFRLYGLHAVTFIHPGIGQVVGAIDLPVSRESTTDYPYIAGTSFKGALRDVARRHWGPDPEDETGKKGSRDERRIFGEAAEGAGDLVVTDVRLLLLPVRSLDAAFRWVTCPRIVARLKTDLSFCDTSTALDSASLGDIEKGQAAVATSDGKVFLEEQVFEASSEKSDVVEQLASEVGKLVPGDLRDAVPIRERLLILHDDDFAWFARTALPVRMRNALDDRKLVKSGHLWSEEYLAPDTVLWLCLGSRRLGAPSLDTLEGVVRDDGWFLQVGGNETVGHGWLAVQPYGGSS